MNDGDLPVAFGGPLRLRVPRQLGYNSLKYITRPTVTHDLKRFGKGHGSVRPKAALRGMQAFESQLAPSFRSHGPKP